MTVSPLRPPQRVCLLVVVGEAVPGDPGLPVPQELANALREFASGGYTGKIQVSFLDGAMTTVEANRYQRVKAPFDTMDTIGR